jgi:hypothetical protein
MTRQNQTSPQSRQLAGDAPLTLPAQFRGVGIDTETVRVSLLVESGRLPLAKAREYFRNTELEVRLEADPNAGADANGQGRMINTTEATLEGTAICRKYSDGGKGYAASLRFPRSEILLFGEDGVLDTLARFTNSVGRVTLTRLGEAPERGSTESEEGDDD